jgi:hypothetical protein
MSSVGEDTNRGGSSIDSAIDKKKVFVVIFSILLVIHIMQPS